jgi:excisionase family DNA binding protein
MEERYVDADIAAQHLGISREFLLKLTREGKVPGYALSNGNTRLRRTWRFKISQLDQYMENNNGK